MTKLKKVKSLREIRNLATTDARYAELLSAAAENLGGLPNQSIDDNYRWLETCANETDEEGVVDEVNFCR